MSEPSEQQWICTGQELECGFSDEGVDAAYKWGDPRRYARMIARLQRIEQAARVILQQIDESVEASLVVSHEATENLRAALEGK